MQYSIHKPPEFICTDLEQLLPSWSMPVLSILIVLQLCQFAFIERTVETEIYKQQLRQQFIVFGNQVVLRLQKMGHLAEMFDPSTGLPLTLKPGIRLSDVKVVNSVLGYSIDDSGQCAMIVHPTWGKAVYPSTLLSSAPPQVLEGVVKSIIEA